MKSIGLAWWQRLAVREQRFIRWGGSALLVALIYAYLWQPLVVERQKLRVSLPQLRADAAKMRVQAEEARRIKTFAASPLSGTALQSAVRLAATGSGWDDKALQINLIDENRVNVSGPSISFDAWTTFVAQLQKGQRIRLESCNISGLPESGLVKVQAVLSVAIK